MIYAVSSRPSISILRNGSGRGPIPLRQSVITNSKREIVKYNHSKWMTITGNWGGRSPAQYVTMSGSANFSLFASAGDEQVQTILSSRLPGGAPQRRVQHTWSAEELARTGYGIKGSEGRMAERAVAAEHPEGATWGKGIYKYLTPEGE